MAPVPGVVVTLLVAFIVSVTVVAGQDTLPQEELIISVRGTFRQSGAGIPTCTECDCTSGTCEWVDNFNCTDDRPTAGPDDNQQRWGTSSCGGSGCICFSKSGVGFQGVTNLALVTNPDNNEPSRVGKITHYNNVIGDGSPTRLQLTLNVTSPQLPQYFIIAYPLDFKETDNTVTCDPGIQRTGTPCDDIFVFLPIVLESSFNVGGWRYTLEIVGFLQPQFGLTSPIRSFVTEESHATTADIYARIVSFCAAVDCGPRGEPGPAPECGCICSLTEEDCHDLFGPTYSLTDECSCACPYNDTVCPDGFVNPDNCGCACNITDEDCFDINPLFQLNPDPELCNCVCNKETVLECSKQGDYWSPNGDDCSCVCIITDERCVEDYDENHSANFDECKCETETGDGLSGGAIAGIVIGSVGGASLLALFVIGAAAALVCLIRQGKIPGIYGYKLDAADLTAAQNSALFKDKWSVAGNQVS